MFHSLQVAMSIEDAGEHLFKGNEAAQATPKNTVPVQEAPELSEDDMSKLCSFARLKLASQFEDVEILGHP